MVFQKKQKLVQMERNLMMQLLTRDFRKRRADQLLQLKRWEEDINKVTCGKPIIKVENSVDLEEPPIGFTYINQCKVNLELWSNLLI
jgi:[histone H3]-lysine9 N-trimethyltransferase SUV39H